VGECALWIAQAFPVDGSATVNTTTYFVQPERVQWTHDGQCILAEDYAAPAYTLWVLDPVVREPEVVAVSTDTIRYQKHRLKSVPPRPFLRVANSQLFGHPEPKDKYNHQVQEEGV
jgi:hypothetical protein